MIHTAPGMNPGMKPWILYLNIIGQSLSETYLFKSPLLGQLRKTLPLDHATMPILGVTNRIENSDAGIRAWFSKMYTDFLLGLKTAIWEIVLGPKMSTQPLLSSVPKESKRYLCGPGWDLVHTFVTFVVKLSNQSAESTRPPIRSKSVRFSARICAVTFYNHSDALEALL